MHGTIHVDSATGPMTELHTTRPVTRRSWSGQRPPGQSEQQHVTNPPSTSQLWESISIKISKKLNVYNNWIVIVLCIVLPVYARCDAMHRPIRLLNKYRQHMGLYGVTIHKVVSMQGTWWQRKHVRLCRERIADVRVVELERCDGRDPRFLANRNYLATSQAPTYFPLLPGYYSGDNYFKW